MPITKRGKTTTKPVANAKASSASKLSLRDRIRQEKADGKVFIIPADAEFEVIEQYENNSLVQTTCSNDRVIELWQSWLLDDAIFTELNDGSLQLNTADPNISVNSDGKVQWIKRKPVRK